MTLLKDRSRQANKKPYAVRKLSDPSQGKSKNNGFIDDLIESLVLNMSVKRNLRAFMRLFRNKFILLCTLILICGFCYLLTDNPINETEDFELDDIEKRVYRRTKDDKIVHPTEIKSGGVIDLNFMHGTTFTQGVKGNFEPMEEKIREGPGEDGKPVQMQQDDPRCKKAIAEFGFNTAVSDQISLNRSIPDTRPEECKHWNYPEKLPTASVVIVFHNEGWSPLLRTVHSVLNRSPTHLLHEVLMVDDFSHKDHLKERLEDYVAKFNGRVRLIRNPERHGLIRSRSTGAQQAKGDVVIFLDAHCEANQNWLPALLAPIAANRKVMTVPLIDSINMYNWGYYQQYGTGSTFRGIFDWGLLYKESELPAKEDKHRLKKTQPYNAPTHAGGLFAIDRNWFEELGFYDEGLQIWGGENFELSFKIWQCGGGVLFVPCSRVGHVYRNRMPYNFGKLSGPVISLNYKRVAEVWMDEYIEYYYTREPFMRRRDSGDVSKQIKIRQKLQCNSFKWFMDNVAYDVYDKYPLLPPNVEWGEARNVGTDLCIDTMNQPVPGTMGVSGCHGQGGNQMFRINARGQMATGEWCINVVANRIQTGRCVMGTVDGPWTVDKDSQQIHHKTKDMCVTVTQDLPPNLTVEKCILGSQNQKWQWKQIWV